jgi:hypothetical protein
VVMPGEAHINDAAVPAHDGHHLFVVPHEPTALKAAPRSGTRASKK